MCAGLPVRIEGGIHAVDTLVNEHLSQEEWGFLLVDTRNAFNESNRTQMLWSVWFEWPRGERFMFNTYKHWSTLIIRDKNRAYLLTVEKE